MYGDYDQSYQKDACCEPKCVFCYVYCFQCPPPRKEHKEDCREHECWPGKKGGCRPPKPMPPKKRPEECRCWCC